MQIPQSFELQRPESCKAEAILSLFIAVYWSVNTYEHLEEIVKNCLPYKKEVSSSYGAQYVDGKKFRGRKV